MKIFNFIQTVKENAQMFAKQQYERAREARRLYNIIGNPSINDYKSIIKMNTIRNCPITMEDIDIAEKIFGKNIAT